MRALRDIFKETAETNEKATHSLMGSDFQNIWQILERCNKQTNICFDVVANSSKQTVLLIMLKNAQSDLLCCLDNVERGHGQTVENNIRMVVESFCLVFHVHNDETDIAWQNYQKNKHETPESISYCKKNSAYYKKIGHLYGLLSNISHQSKIENVARNIDRSGTHYLLKPFTYSEYNQCRIAFIVMLFYETAKLAEEIAISKLQQPYFWVKIDKGWQENTNLPEYVLIQNMSSKIQKQYLNMTNR